MIAAADHLFQDLPVGRKASCSFIIDAAQMELFARLSGDENPLHCDEVFAVARGFRGRVVYGGLIIAAISRLLGMTLPGKNGVWTGLKIDFANPLYIGEPALVKATVDHRSEATNALDILIRVEATDRVIALGMATAVMRSGAG